MAERDKVKEQVKVEVRFKPQYEPVSKRASFKDGDLEDAMLDADWSRDPGTGRAIIMPDGSEVLNPVPMAPPLGYRKEESIIEMIERQVKARFELMKGDEEVDSAEEAEDFGEDTEFMPFSFHEVLMVDEFPDIPKGEPPKVSEPEVPKAAKKEKAPKVEPADDVPADEDGVD